MYDFYEYPKCSTCRKAKATLERLGIDYNPIDIKLNPPKAEQFEKWFADVPVKKFFNTSGLVYREMGLKDKLADLTEHEAAELLASNGMLVKRPLIVKEGNIVLIGFKEEAYQELAQ
ncbi:Spx/MgsR family RNA polymerase-binding regulatory protein [Lactococcus garvieae]|nr:Spx/MgsR family RNA polymerase-binding regulatory protein [Lactococcus garvieae]